MAAKHFWSALTFLAAAPLVLAQEEEGTITLSQLIEDGGLTMWVLFALSVCAAVLVIFFALTLRMGLLMPRGFQDEAMRLAGDGDVEALHEACRSDGSAGARIVGAAAHMLQTVPDADYGAVRSVVEDEGGRHANTLWARIQYLADIATVAPMVGLLGTVLGMIEAFVGLRQELGLAKPEKLADGVSKAMVTTAAGLIVGIAAMILYSYFRGHVGKLISRLEERCSEVLRELLASRAAGRNR